MSNILISRANILGSMNEYIKEFGDECATGWWHYEGLPDECDEDMLMEIASVEKDFLGVVYAFHHALTEEPVEEEEE